MTPAITYALIFFAGMITPTVILFLWRMSAVTKIATSDAAKAWRAGLIEGTPKYRWLDVLPKIFFHSWKVQMRSCLLYGTRRTS